MSGATTRMPAAEAGPRPLCRAVWGHVKGYIEVRDPFAGTVHEIPYHQATSVWKHDIQQYMKAKR